ncbi:hypothetical protein EXIGLDRAFT_281681 [Exidia glandulosa HHB12029]|uniref:F-box domain-containing protein n=1 Tax=Exidia glandulosa HHB12029 TaxID=1314781 RepID=A0A165DIT6_EXIGL|nr:hypothetical protein EXIGLDRAFT_281681 [Exidia glandulosa HHB12029]
MSTPPSTSCGISDLPVELFLDILDFMHFHDLARCRSVSPEWREKVSAHPLWRDVISVGDSHAEYPALRAGLVRKIKSSATLDNGHAIPLHLEVVATAEPLYLDSATRAGRSLIFGHLPALCSRLSTLYLKLHPSLGSAFVPLELPVLKRLHLYFDAACDDLIGAWPTVWNANLLRFIEAPKLAHLVLTDVPLPPPDELARLPAFSSTIAEVQLFYEYITPELELAMRAFPHVKRLLFSNAATPDADAATVADGRDIRTRPQDLQHLTLHLNVEAYWPRLLKSLSRRVDLPSLTVHACTPRDKDIRATLKHCTGPLCVRVGYRPLDARAVDAFLTVTSPDRKYIRNFEDIDAQHAESNIRLYALVSVDLGERIVVLHVACSWLEVLTELYKDCISFPQLQVLCVEFSGRRDDSPASEFRSFLPNYWPIRCEKLHTIVLKPAPYVEWKLRISQARWEDFTELTNLRGRIDQGLITVVEKGVTLVPHGEFQEVKKRLRCWETRKESPPFYDPALFRVDGPSTEWLDDLVVGLVPDA